MRLRALLLAAVPYAADHAAIGAAIDKGVKFSDTCEGADFTADGTCPKIFTGSNADGNMECLKLKEGMDTLASRLETTRYASIKGASTEFRKMEGQACDPATNRIYVAMTQVSKAMTDADEKTDLVGRNDIRVPKNDCGAVYEMQLDSDFVGTEIKGIVTGIPKEYAKGSPEEANTCDVDGISSPDNLTFITGQNILLIAEDTDAHQNDMVWARVMAKGAMTRIMSTPYGAQATSVDWYPDVNGHGYLMAVVQHPFGESDEDKLQSPDEKNAWVGYIGPFPAMNQAFSLRPDAAKQPLQRPQPPCPQAGGCWFSDATRRSIRLGRRSPRPAPAFGYWRLRSWQNPETRIAKKRHPGNPPAARCARRRKTRSKPGG